MIAPLEERLHEFIHSLAGQKVGDDLVLEHNPTSVTAAASAEAYRRVMASFFSIFPEYRSAFQNYAVSEINKRFHGI